MTLADMPADLTEYITYTEDPPWFAAVFTFPNGYVGSVIRNPDSYGSRSRLYEIATGVSTGPGGNEWVFADLGLGLNGRTVQGWLTPEDLADLLHKIKALPNSTEGNSAGTAPRVNDVLH